MAYSGSLAKLPGRAAAPLLIRAAKSIEWGAAPPVGSNDCGIAISVLSPLLEMPKLSGAPPLSRVVPPVGATEYR